jgi:hypothetical protein
VVVTFRFPRDLASWLGAEAKQRGWAMNEFLVTLTHDLYASYAMPDMVTDELERDREALGLDRRTYVMRVLMRPVSARHRGAGLDSASASRALCSTRPGGGAAEAAARTGSRFDRLTASGWGGAA